jgi:hypothetical protein
MRKFFEKASLNEKELKNQNVNNQILYENVRTLFLYEINKYAWGLEPEFSSVILSKLLKIFDLKIEEYVFEKLIQI